VIREHPLLAQRSRILDPTQSKYKSICIKKIIAIAVKAIRFHLEEQSVLSKTRISPCFHIQIILLYPALYIFNTGS
jgi:hypothetical protein